MAPEWLSEKISDFEKYERIIYSFEARDLEIRICREIFRYRDFMNTLNNFAKSVFAYIFAKQFILTESPDHVLLK